MTFWDMAVHIKVACRLGHFHGDSIHFRCHNHLTSQPTGFRQPKRHIQHIFFVFRRLGQVVKDIHWKYQMTRAAGTDTFAGALQINVVAMRRPPRPRPGRRATVWLSSCCCCVFRKAVVVATLEFGSTARASGAPLPCFYRHMMTACWTVFFLCLLAASATGIDVGGR